jgi:pyridoxal phosphate enzyme (YggS family)
MDAMIQAEKLQAIVQNLLCVNEKILKAAHSVDRKPEDVQLVVVSKMHSLESIQAAIQAGARKFGENYAEEAIVKIEQIPHRAGLEWHMIGHIQSRKARLVSDHFDMVHSIDSLRIAERLNVFREGNIHPLPVLLEMNLSGEESKYGWSAQDEGRWEELLPEIVKVVALPNLKVMGLMTMPPLFDNPELTRPFFKLIVKFRDFLRTKMPGLDWEELSMGTSNDYEIAIQEGATILRIGQAILGPRPVA